MRSIVLVTGGLDCGGAQRVLTDMANYWAGEGWRVTVATWSGPELADFYTLLPNVVRVWLNVETRGASPFAAALAFVRRISRMRALLRESAPDAVLSFIDVSNIHTVIAAFGLPLRLVISERTHPGLNRTIGWHWRVLRRLCYRRADRVVAQTGDAARWLERHCGARVAVIPNFLRTLPVPARQRERLIVAIGRLSREKGFDVLLDAFARIRDRCPDWRLCIIGAGPERAALGERARRLKLADCVDLVGQVQEIEPWLARAAIMVHPSRREGFPNAVLEAMAMGVAVICAHCQPGLQELIEDGLNGLLVPVDDPDTLARAMLELIAHPDVREGLGAEAGKIRQRHAPGALMEKWEACIVPQPKVRAA